MTDMTIKSHGSKVDLSDSPSALARLQRAAAIDVRAIRAPSIGEMKNLAHEQLRLEGLLPQQGPSVSTGHNSQFSSDQADG